MNAFLVFMTVRNRFFLAFIVGKGVGQKRSYGQNKPEKLLTSCSQV